MLSSKPKPKPAWVGRYGTYRLIKWKREDAEQNAVETIFLKDRRGRIVTRLTDFRVSPLFETDPPILRDLDHDGEKEIILTTWTGGAHGSNTYQIWSLGRHPYCMLAYDKNNVSDEHDFDFVDLDGDGIPEIRTWYDGFAYTVSGSNWQNLPIVLKLEHGRYVERTSRYPKLLAQAAHETWIELKSSDMSKEPASWSGPSSAAINLIALADITGTRPAVWRRLKRALPAKTYDWLKKREPAILGIVRGRKLRYAYPKAFTPTAVKFGSLMGNSPLYQAFSK